MSIKVALSHVTSYRYDRKVAVGPQVIRLRPAPHCRAKVLSYSQKVEPAGHFLNWQQDPFGNFQARAVFPEKVDHLKVSIDLVLEMIAINPFDFFLEDDAYFVPFSYEPELAADLKPYMITDTAVGPAFEKLVTETRALWDAEPEELGTIDFLVEVNRRVSEMVGYIVRMEPGVQKPEETLSIGRGSCRDSAWLLVNLLRRLGIAARFVSGYLIQLVSDEKPLTGPAGPEEDFTDLHAWAEAYVPGAGWIGMDATSGLFAGEGHIPLAATPSPRSAAPITGGLEPCEVSFDFEMDVQRLNDPPRATKPMSAAQFAQVDSAGRKVDQILQANDVRLTMGGEPTFVSATDWDADEWTIGAVGPTKRHYADDLVRRLLPRFAPGGLLTHGQGKWYPGEPLPRWAFSLVWRKDGVPLWSDPDLIAREHEHQSVSAVNFATTLAETLGLEGDCAQPLFEDPAEYLLKEASLPVNLSPETNKLENPVDRAKLAKVFQNGLGKPFAMVLPLQQAQSAATGGRTVEWMSEIWKSRRGNLIAVPGDSPAGFRLPIQSLPYINSVLYPHVYDPDTFGGENPLPTIEIKRQTPGGDPGAALEPRGPFEGTPRRPEMTGGVEPDPDPKAIITDAVRTALTIEKRDGILHCFLPPVSSAEGYVDLIAAIEETAKATGSPVRIEGYPAPKDHRLQEIKVTPDPGVIEINIHPSASWDELKNVTEGLYAEARAAGLDSAGFQTDGRPMGSGGGAHVVLGGATPADSPFLRRPDLLGSLVRIWQRHPALSYIFAGQFIGPTSQAPRIDDARSDQLYEVELALKQLPEAGDTGFPPWLVDRVLRHLLIDVTGNTHRAEICIDKLYSPDGPTGRLGLVEFRAFEMPPHWQMNLSQMLLVRALIAWAWKEPFTAPLIDHGPALQDKFLLPDVLWEDFKALLAKLSGGLGIQFDPEWYRAQFEFRFPLLGLFEVDGVKAELRSALEPWHVLGEEGTAGGTSRFVDSSLNRVQVKLTGAFDPLDHAMGCNQVEMPLHELGQAHVGGVRFRTWLPASCLHPTIPPTPRLTFDLVSRQEGRSLGGATYWATHPGGRNYETRPVNALEAQSRVQSRFFPGGHTPGPLLLAPTPANPRARWTLDLRQVS